ncbi:MAG: S-layer homology domain-containing protein [Alkaliphilus sp.]
MSKKMILSAICIIFTITTISFSFANELDTEQGNANGEVAGTELGTVYGNSFFGSGKDNDWASASLNDSSIISLFDLERDTTHYRNAFISSFNTAFEAAFKTAFRDSSLSYALDAQGEDVVLTGMDDGSSIGAIFGTSSGKRDFLSNKINDWNQSVLSEKQIIDYFNLSLENNEYKQSFIEGFTLAFAESYVTSFRNANIEDINNMYKYKFGTVSETVFAEGKTITSTDQNLSIEFPVGTVFREVSLEIAITELPIFNPWDMYTVISRAYEVNVLKHGFIVLNRPITISFPYFWDHRGGIFYQNDSGWTYLPSVIENNRITTVINDPLFYGKEFVVLRDNKYIPFTDITWHWANGEIDYFLRRRFIDNECAEKRFNPDETMSRGEFIQLLDRVFAWSNVQDTEFDITRFKDYSILNEYRDSFEKAVSRGIILGNDDSTLRPHMPITYREVEWIIGREIPHKLFSWEDISSELLLEEFHLSAGKENKDANITRAEVIYLLNKLLDY